MTDIDPFFTKLATRMIDSMDSANVLSDNMTGARRDHLVKWLGELLAHTYNSGILIGELNLSFKGSGRNDD